MKTLISKKSKPKSFPFGITINEGEETIRISKRINKQSDFKEIILNENLEIIGTSNEPIKG